MKGGCHVPLSFFSNLSGCLSWPGLSLSEVAIREWGTVWGLVLEVDLESRLAVASGEIIMKQCRDDSCEERTSFLFLSNNMKDNSGRACP